MAGVGTRIKALFWLRWRLLVNGMRTGTGVASAVVGVLAGLMMLVLSVVLAGAAVGILVALKTSESADAFVCFGAALAVPGLLGFLIPFAFGEAKLELSPRRLLVFPVAVRELYWITVGLGFVSGANLMLYPSYLAVVVTAAVTGWALWPAVLLGVVGLAGAVVVWQQLLIAGVRAIASHRRVREIAAVSGIFLLILISLLPQVAENAGWFSKSGSGPPEAVARSGKTAVVAGRVVLEALPPVLAGRTAGTGTLAGVLLPFLALLLWSAAGLALFWKVFRWQLRASGGTSRGGGGAKRERSSFGALELLPPEVAGLAAKQVRYLMRSTAGRIALLTAPIMALFFGFAAKRIEHGVLGLNVMELAFLGVCFFSASFIGNFSYNMFMWDGDGAPLYFMVPVPVWKISLGLTVGVWIFESALLAETVAVWFVLAGVPAPPILIMGPLLAIGMTLMTTGLGSVLSILFPVPREIGSTRNNPAMLSGFASVLVMPVVMALLGLAPGLFLVSGHRWTAAAVMVGCVAVSAVGYRLLLHLAASLFLRRRESLLGALKA